MPLDFDIDEQRNLVTARAHGPVGLQDVLEYLARINEDPRLRPGYRSWLDLSEVDASAFDAEGVRHVAELSRRFDSKAGAARVAVLAPGDAPYGLARMYSMLVDALQRDVRVFRDAHEAHAWLCSEPAGGDAAA